MSDEEKAERLLGWCREAFENPAWNPVADNPETKENERKTSCNLAVNFIAEKFGYTAFKGMLANRMITLMESDKTSWMLVGFQEAQETANAGELVIMGIQSNPHGHVVVVRPGHAVYSQKWKCAAPSVVNIGSENSWDKTANWVFEDKPKAWRLIS